MRRFVARKEKKNRSEDGKLLNNAPTSLLNKASHICSNVNYWFQIPLDFVYN